MPGPSSCDAVSLTPPRDEANNVVALVTQSMLHHDLPDATADEVTAAIDFVEDSVAAMPDVTRFGVRLASIVVYTLLSIQARAPFRRLPLGRRATVAHALAGKPLPIIGEFFRLTRGLGLVGAFEARSSMEPAGT